MIWRWYRETWAMDQVYPCDVGLWTSSGMILFCNEEIKDRTDEEIPGW